MIVDVDDPSTWPAAVAEFVDDCEAELQGLGLAPTELVVPAGVYDERLVHLLAGHRLRAYHCARLLECEAAAIRSQGLRPLSGELVPDKLENAVRCGAITAEERARLHEHRRLDSAGLVVEGRVCLALSTADFGLAAHFFNPLPSCWGGEAIYAAHESGATGLAGLLRGLGRPSIVVAQLEASAIAATPSLTGSFVAVAAGWPAEEHGADIAYAGPVPPDFVEDVWHPGDADYDRFPDLVRD
ncbi:hypothetical protein ABIA35_008115 [Catenulispora sp. MAP12-49]|uniref:hypothetical protein n=1 Tax=Catenulispora sp. MAP12-49 TaxID=3156302 RepID=UPI00351123FD